MKDLFGAANHDELRANHDELRANHDELRANHDELRANRDELRANHDTQVFGFLGFFIKKPNELILYITFIYNFIIIYNRYINL